jgi:hypothetical protein
LLPRGIVPETREWRTRDAGLPYAGLAYAGLPYAGLAYFQGDPSNVAMVIDPFDGIIRLVDIVDEDTALVPFENIVSAVIVSSVSCTRVCSNVEWAWLDMTGFVVRSSEHPPDILGPSLSILVCTTPSRPNSAAACNGRQSTRCRGLPGARYKG